MMALVQEDLDGASAETGVRLTQFFLEDDALWLWRYRLSQLAADPRIEPWLVRIVALDADGAVVGHGGFHGAPDADGMVELGYGVDPAHRRKGYARAMLIELLSRATADPQIKVVRAAIRPDNVASLATINGFGFTQVGEQIDEIDGLELLFERPA
ncbi:MAG: GNAT family N-acetyltransferase [Corynebacteriales bacterium]|nr:GNAT family N-acetyltransferase [Mycobacteriales bacterium]